MDRFPTAIIRRRRLTRRERPSQTRWTPLSKTTENQPQRALIPKTHPSQQALVSAMYPLQRARVPTRSQEAQVPSQPLVVPHSARS